MTRKRLLLSAALLMAGVAVAQFAGAALIYGKAWLAPILIQRAYATGGVEARAVKPWPWADTWPVARLAVPQLGIERFVLQGDSGHAMAFGPGMAPGPHPGEPGLVMISAHRDTHFRFLKELAAGDTIDLEYAGRAFSYRVSDVVIADARVGTIAAPLPGRGLLLVTCYPFDAVTAGGPLRYVVIARELLAGSSATSR